MTEPTMGDAFEGSQAEWDAYLQAWRQAHAPRNPKLRHDPVKVEGEAWRIEDAPGSQQP